MRDYCNRYAILEQGHDGHWTCVLETREKTEWLKLVWLSCMFSKLGGVTTAFGSLPSSSPCRVDESEMRVAVGTTPRVQPTSAHVGTCSCLSM